MSTICDLCEEHGFRLQSKYNGKLYCLISDELGPMEGQHRVKDPGEPNDDVYVDAPPYRCIKEEYVPSITPIL